MIDVDIFRKKERSILFVWFLFIFLLLQAFLEMAEEGAAISMVNYFSSGTSAQLRGRNVFVQYSNHSQLKTDQSHSNAVSVASNCSHQSIDELQINLVNILSRLLIIAIIDICICRVQLLKQLYKQRRLLLDRPKLKEAPTLCCAS